MIMLTYNEMLTPKGEKLHNDMSRQHLKIVSAEIFSKPNPTYINKWLLKLRRNLPKEMKQLASSLCRPRNLYNVVKRWQAPAI